MPPPVPLPDPHPLQSKPYMPPYPRSPGPARSWRRFWRQDNTHRPGGTRDPRGGGQPLVGNILAVTSAISSADGLRRGLDSDQSWPKGSVSLP